MKSLEWIVHWIDVANERIGRAMGWLLFALVMLVSVDVASRYFFNTGAVWIQESEWWLFSIIFLMGAGYTFLHDGHVRVDIIYSRLSQKGKNYVDLSCAFIFLFPMCVLIIITSYTFIAASWEVGEYSPDPGGLPMYYLLKGIIPLGFTLLALQGAAGVYKILRRIKEEQEAQGEEERP
ncbi:MAG: TRAP transporter small permease subunit [SAR324 cluster bacterium]|nr:TRAP transporter small permease subunit [SAR324 cluster bacterium]MCZ6628813.1 TRAP transporter small permease subunit [SAR324 cluster bacterium]MCZ6644871.1 TRAP transporter small permease subunit [SAR324 cluster bacterium]MCZ6841940.1 TRAP transporter small permease subunit [SAR324 cluster bacterium]